MYDKNGNLTISPERQEYISYNPYFNLPAYINTYGGYTTIFKYGPGGERIERWTQETSPERTFYIRGQNDYALVEKDVSPNATRLYVYGPGGLIALKDNGNWYFVLKDHLGSTRVVLSQSNSAVAKYHYAPFGKTMWAQVSQNPKYRFTGQEFDEQTGLYNFRARLYDANPVIFSQSDKYGADPAGQGFASYAYCGNNPVMFIDKDGREPLLILAQIIGAYMGVYESVTRAIDAEKINSPFELIMYTAAGGGIGYLSGSINALIGTSGIPFSNTLGTIASSTFSSTAQSALAGSLNISTCFGIGTYNWTNDKWKWAFTKTSKNDILNTLSYISDAFNVINFANDVYAAAFVPYKEVAEAEKKLADNAEKAGYKGTMSNKNTPTPVKDLIKNWLPIGDGPEFYDVNQKILQNNPPLGKFINGANRSYRIGRWHIGNFRTKAHLDLIKDFQTFIHADYFDINKNLLWHMFEWIITPTNPVGAL